MISGDMETMHGSATKYKSYRSPSIARIVTFRTVHVGHVSRTEETRNEHIILVEISLVKSPLIVCEWTGRMILIQTQGSWPVRWTELAEGCVQRLDMLLVVLNICIPLIQCLSNTLNPLTCILQDPGRAHKGVKLPKRSMTLTDVAALCSYRGQELCFLFVHKDRVRHLNVCKTINFLLQTQIT